MSSHLCNELEILKIFLFHLRWEVFIIVRSDQLIVSSFSDISIWISYQQTPTVEPESPVESFHRKCWLFVLKVVSDAPGGFFPAFCKIISSSHWLSLVIFGGLDWRVGVSSQNKAVSLSCLSHPARVSHLDLIKPISDTGITKKLSAQALIYSITDFNTKYTFFTVKIVAFLPFKFCRERSALISIFWMKNNFVCPNHSPQLGGRCFHHPYDINGINRPNNK